MRHLSLFTLALAALLAAPSFATGQDRKEVRPTIDAPRVGETLEARIPDREIAPIAEAIRRGEPASRIETNWKALLERHADGLEEGDAGTLTLRVVRDAWEPMEADLDEGLRDLTADDACADQTRAIDRHRSALRTALAAGDGATARDVETAAASFAALSDALEACEATLSRADRPAPRAIQPPAAREPVKEAEAERPARVRAGIAPAADEDADGDQADAALQTVGDDAQLANVDMQNWLQQQQQALQAMSNISKAAHDTAMAIIQNMK